MAMNTIVFNFEVYEKPLEFSKQSRDMSNFIF